MSMPSLNEGALAPVRDEVTVEPLKVTGTIPDQLNGTLIRNGPNPFSGRFAADGVLNWWPEAAMLHGISLAQGQATGYRNRWVRTQRWADYQATAAGDNSPTTWVDSNPNVNVIEHAGRVLALAEGGIPATINVQLDTLGPPTTMPLLARGVTAHPKRDVQTGELMVFCADWAEPWLRYGVLDQLGATLTDQDIEVPAPAMMHDMAITQTHSILFDLNVAYDFSMLANGHRIPIRWQAERRSRLGILPRHGGTPSWLEIEPCFIQHVVNAYDTDNGAIVLDVARYPTYFQLDASGAAFAPNPLAVLWRYTINLQTGQVAEGPLDDLNIELPRINEAYTGCHNNHCYAVVQPTDAEMRGIVAYNLSTGARTQYRIPAPDQNSEPVYVPRTRPAQSLGGKPSAENDGWLLVCVYRQATDSSELHILEASSIDAGPVATVDLSRRIPAGFHGAWIPAT